MPTLRIFQIDAFTSRLFHGNPAAVVPLDAWLSDDTMQAIAAENNLAETAFFAPSEEDGADFHLRWFTPAAEIELCGHATLATAHALWNHLGFAGERIAFSTERVGALGVERDGEGRLVLDFPARPSERLDPANGLVREIGRVLGRAPDEVHVSRPKILAVYENKRDVHELRPDLRALAELEAQGVIVTAPAAGHDFVSRFFAPALGVDEDPVTGSAHCVLAPYWAGRLGKTSLTAHQVSPRGGELWCEVRGDRVRIAGHAVTYLRGEIDVPG